MDDGEHSTVTAIVLAGRVGREDPAPAAGINGLQTRIEDGGQMLWVNTVTSVPLLTTLGGGG